MQTTIDRRRAKLASFGLTVQPYIIAVGSDAIHAVYVVVDSKKYEVPTVLKAVDICFKAFQALHAAYPVESYPVWIFLQRAVFDITTKWDREVISVNSLLTEL